MPTSWEQKRAAIAQALAGGNPQSVGANPMVNPMIAAMSPQAPGIAGGAAAPGLMGAAPTQGQMMTQANASLQGAPGFDYVPPAVGPAPAPASAASTASAATPQESMAALVFGGPDAHSMVAGASAQELENMKNAGFFKRRGGGARP